MFFGIQIYSVHISTFQVTLGSSKKSNIFTCDVFKVRPTFSSTYLTQPVWTAHYFQTFFKKGKTFISSESKFQISI